MMEAMITCTTELVQGGCNACPVVPATTYAIRFDQANIPLGGLEVEALVMAVALKKGFRQELIMGLDEDYTLFKKETTEVTLKDFYGTLTYESGAQQLTVKNTYETQEALFEQVNGVLKQLFHIEPVAFIVEEVEA